MIVSREKARDQAGLAAKKYDFLTAQGAQSPELSNGESTTEGVTCRTRIEPAFLGPEIQPLVAKLKTVLDQISKLEFDNCAKVSYVKQDYSAAMLKPGGQKLKRTVHH
ncbi:hypothetical protein FRC12_003171 [Ceratobasidium sp. 428]|nr:hypothetical protein FRC12_003171 [Ceratobasidium sp. 428]